MTTQTLQPVELPTAPETRSIRWGGSALLLAAPLVIAVVCVLDYALALVRPGTRDQVWLWYTVSHWNGVWTVGLAYLAIVLVTLLASARGVPQRFVEPLLVVESAAYFFGTKIWPPTGDQMAWYDNAGTPNVSLSEPLADVVHKIPVWITGNADSVRYVSPVFGVVTVVLLLVLARRLSQTMDVPRWSMQALVVASPIPFWYVTGYVENTFLAIPFVLLGVVLSADASRPDGRRGTIAIAAAAFALAALFHVGFAVLAIAFGLWVLLRAELRARRVLVDLLSAAVGVALTVGSVVAALSVLPVRITPGNAQGGYDGQLFVPFAPRPGDQMFRFQFFSHAHLIEFSNIVVHASPAIVLALPVLLVFAARRRSLRSACPADPAGRALLMLLAALAVGYLLFAAVWGFDLGPVGDLDLMLTMDLGLVMTLAVVASRLLKGHPVALALLISGSAITNIAFYSMKVADVWIS